MIFKSKYECKIISFLILSLKRRYSYVASAADLNNYKLKSIRDEEFNINPSRYPYYVENGLRKVYPYYFVHSTNCKGRWVNQNLIDTLHKEFGLFPREDYVQRVLKGQLKVNGKTVGVNYTLKISDLMTQIVHKHELAVLATPIHIIYEDDNLLVVDKPPSLPVHSCALYGYNTVSKILSIEHNYQSLYITYRLDRLTSGVLIYAKNSEMSSYIHSQIRLRTIKKEYICRVEGNFPEETVICNKPIKQLFNKVGASVIDPSGKTCITEFQKLSYNGKSSVVLCKPHTGRTHQIRVHLQFLGYPIVNDPLYNSYVFGPEKGKNGITKSYDQLLADLTIEHSSQWWLENVPEKPIPASDFESNLMDIVSRTYYANLNNVFSNEKYKKDPSRFIYDDDCYFCKKKYRDPKQTNLLMLLHAYKYQSDDWEFKTEMPLWATDDWCVV